MGITGRFTENYYRPQTSADETLVQLHNREQRTDHRDFEEVKPIVQDATLAQ